MNDYKQAKRIEIKTKRLVLGVLAGAYRSAFRGHGLDFEALRPYTPGDDIRHINWQVTARAQRPFIKQYIEERQLTLLLLVDVSHSTAFEGQVKKQERLIELTAVLATAAHLNQDHVGLLLFSDQVEAFVRPNLGRNHLQRLIHTMMTTKPTSKGTDVGLALQTTVLHLKRRSMVILLSDLLAPPQTYQRALQAVRQRHDLVTIRLVDPLEQTIPTSGLIQLQDMETSQRQWIDSHDTTWQAAMIEQVRAHETAVVQTHHHAHVDMLTLPTTAPYLPKLQSFFNHRHKKRGHK